MHVTGIEKPTENRTESGEQSRSAQSGKHRPSQDRDSRKDHVKMVEEERKSKPGSREREERERGAK